MNIFNIFKKKLKKQKEQNVSKRVEKAISRRLQRKHQMETVPELIALAKARSDAGKSKCRTPNYKFIYNK